VDNISASLKRPNGLLGIHIPAETYRPINFGTLGAKLKNTSGKVCVVLPYATAYSETFLRTHVEHLAAPVNYLSRFPVEKTASCRDRAEYEETGGLKLWIAGILTRYALNPIKAITVRNFFKVNNIKVVLAEYGVTGIGVMKICRDLSVPLVVHFHGYDAYSRQVLDAYALEYEKLFAYSNGIIAVSRPMVDQLVKIGAPKNKVFYNPCGVDISAFDVGGRKKARLQVIATGRFVEKKAPYLTLLAFKKVLEVVPEARLVMVGDGTLWDVCQKLADSLRMRDAVQFTGAVPHNEVARLMQESRIFVQHSVVPSSGDSEGTPVGILEAGASGLPIVSTRHGGIVDAVIDGETGFLVDEGDIDGMAERICRLLSNQNLADEMGRRARQHISRNFALDNSIKNLRAILEQCSFSKS
jgi:colanic acid/amylovoran biosynthesis glycosyltransferase